MEEPQIDPQTAKEALEASVRTYEEESDRSKTLEQKAAVTLAASGAILAVFAASASELGKRVVPNTCGMLLVLGLLLFLGASFILAFLTLKTRPFLRAKTEELLSGQALSMTPAGYAWKLAVTYEEAIRANKPHNDAKADLFSWALNLVLVSVVLIIALVLYSLVSMVR